MSEEKKAGTIFSLYSTETLPLDKRLPNSNQSNNRQPDNSDDTENGGLKQDE